MPAPLPNFVRRAWRLLEARRALLEGAPERALEHLRDPILSLSAEADRLRERALSALYRHAALRAQEGRAQSVARVLGVVAGEDPGRAHEWSLQLGPRSLGRGEEVAGSQGAPGAANRESRLLGLLSDLRAGGGKQASEAREAAASEPPPGGSSSKSPSQPARALPLHSTESRPDGRVEGAPRRLHLAVDDGGDLFCVCGTSITLGHAQSGLADVPLFADLEALHVRLERRVSFHGGSTWRLFSLVSDPEEANGVGVSGRRVGVEGEELVDGDEVRLAPKVAFRFVAPEASSSSVRLDLLHGLEAEGAARVLCWVEGLDGRVRIGAREDRAVPVVGLDHDVRLSWDSDGIQVACEGGVRRSGAQPESELQVSWPLAGRVQLVAGARPSQPVPFGLALDPVDGPGPAGGGVA